MINYKIEEKIAMIPLLLRIFRYNFISDRKLKYKSFKYGENIKQYYRVYKGKDKDKPLIYFIHGGGWWHGSPKMCTCIGKFFNKLGYTVVLPAYRLVPLYKYPTQIEDIFSAFSHYIKNNKDSFKNGVVSMGFSAGGELCTNLIFNKKMHKKFNINKDIFKGMITFAGVLDFEKCISKHSKTLIANYLGPNYDFSNKNPIDLVNGKENIRVLCVHGDKDPLIDIENSISFVDKISSYGDKGEIEIIKGKHHSDITGLILGRGERESKKIIDFLETLWKVKRKETIH
ncbi:hypothetical protein JCM1393_20520 [Clostridium carnis]